MDRPLSVRDDVIVAVDPLTAYEAVSDITQMARWSPENTGGFHDEGHARRAAYVGMTFVGSNKRGPLRWHTRCTVTAADPGHRFAFRVDRWGLRRPVLPGPIATWEYIFEPTGTGSRVTEIWYDDRRAGPEWLSRIADRLATGSSFHEFQQRNIRCTLDNLKVALEASPNS